MITEDYVSYETAKLLKKSGFDSNEISCINVFKGHTYKIQGTIIDADEDVTIPTIQLAMKWLREKHILVLPEPKSFTLDGEVATWVYNIWCDDNREVNADFFDGEPFEKYEDACEAAIKYCLENLI